MDDIEVPSPVARIHSAGDMDKLIAAFEDRYESVYAGVAKHPQAGYQIFELGLTATIPKVKPKLVKRPLEEKTPPREALKGNRDVYVEGKWHQAAIYDMDQIRPGNQIEGIAVIEAPSTTFFVPPGRRVDMDEWSMLWLR